MGSKVKIIVIDDNEIIRNLMYELLTRKGYEVILASDGTSALTLVKKRKPHLAIVDLVLPDISGVDLLKEIKKLSPNTENIVITGYSSNDNAKKILDTNSAYGLLEKPIDVDRLLEMITDIFAKQKNSLKLQQALDELGKVNYQLEFFNSIIIRDFEIISNSLQDAITSFTISELDAEQEKGLVILKAIHQNNLRLISSYVKIRSFDKIDESDLISTDIVKSINSAIKVVCEEDFGCTFSFRNENEEDSFFVNASPVILTEMFYELFYSLVMPTIQEWTEMDLLLKQTKLQFSEGSKETPCVEIGIITSSKKKNFDEYIPLSELESQNYGLGFYLAKRLIDAFNGKIYLEDVTEDEVIKTKLLIYLPSE
ncbi:MAG: response regulator [Candidatus Heimdallarchaeota archaeon]